MLDKIKPIQKTQYKEDKKRRMQIFFRNRMIQIDQSAHMKQKINCMLDRQTRD